MTQKEIMETLDKITESMEIVSEAKTIEQAIKHLALTSLLQQKILNHLLSGEKKS